MGDLEDIALDEQGAEEFPWTPIQAKPILMPSDISSAPPGTGPVTTRQMTPEERARYQPNRPTRDDLADDLAAGLSGPEIAQKWTVPLARVHALIKYYRLLRTPAETEAKRQEHVELKARIMAEIEKNRQHQLEEIKTKKTENPETAVSTAESMKGREEVAQPKSPAREKLTPEVLQREIQGFIPLEIGKHYGCGVTLVRKLLKEYGIENPRTAANAPVQSETTKASPPTPAPPPIFPGAMSPVVPIPVPVAPTPHPDLPQATNTTKEPAPNARLAPALEEAISSGLNLTARGTYTPDRLSRILAGIMAEVQEAGGEFGAYIEIRGRDASG